MLASLRHDAFVGCNNEKRHVNSARASEHRANERFVPRDVDYAHGADSLENQRSKSEIDSNPAAFLFPEAICIDAGESFYERGLAMIDVTGRSQDHAALPPHAPCSHTRN